MVTINVHKGFSFASSRVSLRFNSKQQTALLLIREGINRTSGKRELSSGAQVKVGCPRNERLFDISSCVYPGVFLNFPTRRCVRGKDKEKRRILPHLLKLSDLELSRTNQLRKSLPSAVFETLCIDALSLRGKG